MNTLLVHSSRIFLNSFHPVKSIMRGSDRETDYNSSSMKLELETKDSGLNESFLLSVVPLPVSTVSSWGGQKACVNNSLCV